MITTNDLSKVLKQLLKVHNVIMISGAPGIGKSEITYQVAKELGLKLYETRLYEQGESAAGLPKIHTDVTQFSKPFWFKEVEEGDYDILFLDDFHLVLPGIQKFLYRLLTDRMLHNYSLKKDIKIILAGNFNIDSANSASIQSPIMGRVECMIQYEPSIKVFLEWAKGEMDRFDTRIIAFLTANPDMLYEGDPAPTVKYPSPRSWEHLSKNIQALNTPIFAPGIVGDRAGSIFIDYWEFLDKNVHSVLESKPEDIKQESIYALILGSTMASEFIKKKKDNRLIDRILKYVQDNLGPDTLFIFARHVWSSIRKMDKTKLPELVKVFVDKFPNIGNEIIKISSRREKLF